MNNITDKLFKLQDKKYQEMQFKIIPNIDNSTIIGVRTPEIRKLAKELIKEDYKSFLEELPHKYFDENQLHAFIISELKNFDECIIYVNNFFDDSIISDDNFEDLIAYFRAFSVSPSTRACL